jgi:hypothetical protein
MRYGGKYSLRRHLIVEGTQNANDEAPIAAAWTQLGEALQSGILAGATATPGGMTGADVIITLQNGDEVPCEAKLAFAGTYGNPSLRGGSGLVNGTFQFGLSASLSDQQKAIKQELQTAIDAANANAEAIAACTKAENANISGTHAGCSGTGTTTDFPNGGIAAKWYTGKAAKGGAYIHIKGYGLYLMHAGSDVLGLNALLPANMQIPVFKPDGGERITVRMKMIGNPSRGKKCNPMAEIKAKGTLAPSPVSLYNLQPLIDALNKVK